jgi:type I restriction enzyme S subunit
MSSERYTLADLAAPVKNAIVGGPFGSNLVSRDYTESGIPVIRGQNMGEKWVSGEFVYVSEDKAKALSQNIARQNDLVFTQRGTLGQVSIVPHSRFDRYVVSQSQMKITVDPEKADVAFLYYLFKTPEQLQYIFNSAIQTGVPHTNLGIFKATPVSLPPLSVQKKISAVMTALDDRIALLRETNATLEAIAQALFKSWFVDFDPVHAKQQGIAPERLDEATAALFSDSFEESALGLVPRGWRIGTLGDIVETVRKQLKPSDLHSELHYVGLEHIPRKSLSLENWDNAEGLESAKAAFGKGDILFGKLRPYFHKVVIAPFDGVCSTDILVCRPKNPAYYGITAMHLFSTPLIDYADRLSNGAKMPRVNWKDLADYPICVPPEALAANYSEVIKSLISRMMANVHQSQTLATLRDTLLPRLISGQLRLPEAEAIFDEAAA